MTSYKTMVLDPPWPEHGSGKYKRGADRHYGLLKPPEIVKVILGCPKWAPADDAHLYLWATDNHLPEALWVMREIGFRYIRTLPWIKLKDEAFDRFVKPQDVTGEAYLKGLLKRGLGQYFRGASELLLFGVRGRGMSVVTERRDLCNIVIGPRHKHSVKPEAAYKLVEERSLGPYLEMFSRGSRPGWDSWGLELQVESTTSKRRKT